MRVRGGGAWKLFPAALGQEGTSISVFLLGDTGGRGTEAPESPPKNIFIGCAHALQSCQEQFALDHDRTLARHLVRCDHRAKEGEEDEDTALKGITHKGIPTHVSRDQCSGSNKEHTGLKTENIQQY